MTHVSFYPLSSSGNEPMRSDHVNTFFTEDVLDFPYRKIGRIEITGEPEVAPEYLFRKMQYEAWKRGANAVIEVQELRAFDEFNVNPVSGSLHTYTGIAVYVYEDASYIAQYGDNPDLSFVQMVENPARYFGTIKSEEAVQTALTLTYFGLILATELLDDDDDSCPSE
ncbi:MAG TPA: hypothetical protein DDX92_02035 [Flavobacteriales bacterium]|jgi:uncharacterized protein YbjQ (UPF0145 family)|nr:hypothetical protein [Flavobacteriales bacterium]